MGGGVADAPMWVRSRAQQKQTGSYPDGSSGEGGEHVAQRFDRKLRCHDVLPKNEADGRRARQRAAVAPFRARCSSSGRLHAQRGFQPATSIMRGGPERRKTLPRHPAGTATALAPSPPSRGLRDVGKAARQPQRPCFKSWLPQRGLQSKETGGLTRTGARGAVTNLAANHSRLCRPKAR